MKPITSQDDDFDPDRYGSAPDNDSVGWPDLAQPSMLDQLINALAGGKMASRSQQEICWAWEAERQRLAEEKHWSAQLAEEATCEGRQHRVALENFHE
jgi:hypothetical protein